MRIVQAIETSGPGGAENVLIGLCSALADRGHQVHAVLLRDGWLKRQLEAQGTAVTVLPLARPLDWRFHRTFTTFLRDNGVEVVHSHEIAFAFYGRLASSKLGISHVATAHGRGFGRRTKRRIIGTFLYRHGKSFRLVAVSEATAKQIARSFFLPSGRIEVIRNGVRLPEKARPAPRDPGEPLKILAIGNLYPVKNQCLAIRAVHSLRRRGIEAELDVLGRGREESRLGGLIGELGLEESARLRGFRRDVAEFLASAHVLVSTSLSEGTPMSFLEAMGRGVPIVASRVGGVPELIESEVDGLLFESNDLEGLVAALERLALDEALRLRLAQSAQRRARERYSADRMVDRYLELYERLARAR